MTNRIGAFALLLALVLSSAPRARACWDGHYAVIGNTTLEGLDDRWNVERARFLAIWLPRIAALSEEGIEIFHDVAELPDGTSIAYPSERLDLLFARAARALDVSRDERRRAMGLGRAPFTVQLAATRDEERAVAMAERLLRENEDLDDPFGGAFYSLHGFYEAGGFPSLNSALHIVEGEADDGSTVYRIVVGAFLQAADAHLAAERLASMVEHAPFVRTL